LDTVNFGPVAKKGKVEKEEKKAKKRFVMETTPTILPRGGEKRGKGQALL